MERDTHLVLHRFSFYHLTYLRIANHRRRRPDKKVAKMTGAADSIVKKVCLATSSAGSSGLTVRNTDSGCSAPSTEHKFQHRPPARNLEFEM